MILINTASTNTANVTGVNEELNVKNENIIDHTRWRRGQGVFNLRASYQNKNQPIRLLSIQDLSEEEKANVINGLDLDVLVDLSGYTHNGEHIVMARRPAVIQVNYLGFPAQLGVEWYDYNEQDSIVTPPHLSHYYQEKLVYLPYFYACNHHNRVPDLHPYQRPAATQYLRNVFHVPLDGTLLCFPNQLYKLTEDLLDTWSNILHRFPESYLWLLRHPTEGEVHIKEEFMARGVYVDRILFSDFEDDKALYMVRTSVCDVILDSPLWSAGATGLDAYWAGVPIIDLPGDRTVERLGISIMVRVR